MDFLEKGLPRKNQSQPQSQPQPSSSKQPVKIQDTLINTPDQKQTQADHTTHNSFQRANRPKTSTNQFNLC